MALLVAPDVSYHSSWLEGSAEFAGAHRHGGGECPPLEELRDALSFRRFVDALVKDALPESSRKPEYVPCTYLWIVDGDVFLGSRAIIEKNGGIYEDTRNGKRRYWVDSP
jgi:predicted acetyltransferase